MTRFIQFITALCSLFFFLFIYQADMAFAQTVSSNCIVTKVGTGGAPQPLPPECQNTGAATGFSKAAETAVNAYKTCTGGKTYKINDDPACLRQSLKTARYPDKSINAFMTRRNFSTGNKCTECAAFVSAIMALYSGTPAIPSRNGGEFASLPEFNAGPHVFKRLAPGTPLLNGDIGSKDYGKWGHVLIVNKVMGKSKFTAYESNYGSENRCAATDSVEHVTSGYVFFRLSDNLTLDLGINYF